MSFTILAQTPKHPATLSKKPVKKYINNLLESYTEHVTDLPHFDSALKIEKKIRIATKEATMYTNITHA